jgi:RNA polymerase primary sigma factor
LGLWKAISKYEPDFGANLSTYASWWIKQSLRRYLANHKYNIRIPVQSQAKIKKIKKAKKTLSEKLMRKVYEHEIAEYLDFTIRTVETLSKVVSEQYQLSGSIDLENGYSFYDYIESMSANDTITPDKILEQKDRACLNEFIFQDDKFDKREIAILTMRYGLDGKAPKTLEEVSKKINRTRERVRQIQNQAAQKYLNYFADKYAKESLTKEDYKIYQFRNLSVSELSEKLGLSREYLTRRLPYLEKYIYSLVLQEYSDSPFYTPVNFEYNFKRFEGKTET